MADVLRLDRRPRRTPTDDPYGSGIVWDHGTAEKSKAAAKETSPERIRQAVDADNGPRATSTGNAVDMTITNLPEKWTFARDGKEVTVDLAQGCPRRTRSCGMRWIRTSA